MLALLASTQHNRSFATTQLKTQLYALCDCVIPEQDVYLLIRPTGEQVGLGHLTPLHDWGHSNP